MGSRDARPYTTCTRRSGVLQCSRIGRNLCSRADRAVMAGTYAAGVNAASIHGRRSRSSARRASGSAGRGQCPSTRSSGSGASAKPEEPGRDRERTERGSHPHRAGRPPLVPGHRPLHAQPRKLTLSPRRVLREVRRSGTGQEVHFGRIAPAFAPPLSGSIPHRSREGEHRSAPLRRMRPAQRRGRVPTSGPGFSIG
jgi:hypothetical protein